jgi:hypothetical protein
MVGRALRPNPDKELAYVLDHAGNVYWHGLPTARRRWTLHGGEQRDEDAERLVRCPECGAINKPGAKYCEHCGEPIARQRRARTVVDGPRLAEAVETPTDDTELELMGCRGALRWAADDDGVLLRDRLKRVAQARGYKPGWVWHNSGKQWKDVWEETRRWCAEMSTR